MGKINVMHIRDSKGIYGAERVILALGKNLRREPFSFSLLCMKHADGKAQDLITRAGELGLPVMTVRVRGKLDLAAILRIRNILKKEHVDIVHSHDYKSDLYALLATLCMPIRRVTTAHGSTRDSFRKRLYLFFTERLMYRCFDRVIAVADEIRRELGSRIGTQRIALVRNGIDASILAGEGSLSNEEPRVTGVGGGKTFAVIGRLFPDKGHRYFLTALAKTAEEYPTIGAWIVGDGPARDAVAEDVRDLGLESTVKLCGVRRDMRNVYGCVDFVVIPSLREGLPYVLLEAMSLRVPVLATAVGEIPSLIEDGATGLLVPPGDAEALAKGMKRLLDSPENARAMAERAFRLVQERFSAERMARSTEALYAGLVA